MPDLRRLIAGAAAAILLGLVVVALVSGFGGGDAADEPAAAPPPPRVGRTVSAPAGGISVRLPRGWSSSRSARGVTLRSPDRAMIIAVAAPPRATATRRLLRNAAQQLRRSYRIERADPAPGRRLAGRPASSIVVTAASRRTRLRVLVSAVQGRRRAWLVEVFSAVGAPAARLAEGQVALNSLRLRG